MLTFDLFTARSNLLPHAFVWAIYIYIRSIEVTCRSTVAKIVLIGNLRWPPFCLCLLNFPATVLFTYIKSWFFRNHLANFHQISHWSYCWNVIGSLFNDHAPLTARPIYSSSKLRTAQMMIFSLVAMIGLEKCYITSAYLPWLFHSGERAVAHELLVYSCCLWRLVLLTLSLPQAIIIAFANSIDPDETAQWAVSSGSTLFDIQSFNFTYKRLSKGQFVKIKKQTTNVVWNLAPKELIQ